MQTFPQPATGGVFRVARCAGTNLHPLHLRLWRPREGGLDSNGDRQIKEFFHEKNIEFFGISMDLPFKWDFNGIF
jgi:hypothetical protein